MLYRQEEMTKVVLVALDARLRMAQNDVGRKLDETGIGILFGQLQRELPWLREAKLNVEFDSRRRQWVLDIDYSKVTPNRGVPGKPNINNKMVECFMCGRPNIEGSETCCECKTNL